ncbi:porin [Aquabacterium humicola]|uniref:porin n=1 Tax=Aquabacterium humicola TaxID=3237377 RepID=UPI0025433083|nr:porin [Rubrivivax pictus]
MKPFPVCRSWPVACSLAAAALALPTIAQAQAVQVGGQIRLTVNRVQTGHQSAVKELRDNASRLSFRGTEDLGDGLRAQFGLEMGFNADSGELTSPAYRYSYVALGGAFGTLALGRLDSGNPTGSPLYSQVTAITTFAANDAGATAIGTSMLNSRNRTSNSIGYRSPAFGGAELMARYYWRGAGTAAEAEDDARSLDLGVLYRAGPVIAGLGYAKDARSGGLKTNELDDKWQAGLRFDAGDIEPYVLFGVDRYRATASTRRDVKFAIVGALAKRGQHSVVLNLLQRDVQANRSGERKRWQAAWLYALSKRTELQAFADSDGIDSTKSDVRVRAIGAGIKHVF